MQRPFAQHRAGEDQPPAVTHHPGGGAGTEERPGEVDIDNVPPHLGRGAEGPGHDRRDPGIADPDIHSAPRRHRPVGHRLVELGVSDIAARTAGSARGARRRPILRSRSVLATNATFAPPRENAWAINSPSPRPAPVSTTRRPLTSPAPGNESGISICSGIALLPIGTVPYRPVHYTTVNPAQPFAFDYPGDDLLEMHRRMLLIRGFEERVAALYRDGEVPGFVHLSTGQEASAVGACWPIRPDRRDHLEPPWSRTLPGQGPRTARHVRRVDGQGLGTNRGRGGSMHIADPSIGIFGANGIVAAGLPIAVGAAAASQLRARRWRCRRLLRGRCHRPRRIPRGAEPRRGVAAPRDLLVREQRLRRVLAGGHAIRRQASSVEPRDTTSATWQSTATTSPPRPASLPRSWRRGPWRRRSCHRRGHHVPLARPLRGGSSALPGRRPKSMPGRIGTLSSLHAGRLESARIHQRDIASLEVVRGTRTRRGGRGGPAHWPSPTPPPCLPS